MPPQTPSRDPDGPRAEAAACLVRVAQGDKDARSELFDLVYAELKRQAQRYLHRERADHTLQPTALVHEAWIRLIGREWVALDGRGDFLALAAQAMRRVLVEHARARGRDKRGGQLKRAEGLDEVGAEPVRLDPVDVLDLDAALERLREESEELARVAELRYFAGLSKVSPASEGVGASVNAV